MAPEVIEEKTYNGKKVDIFALGVITFIIVNGGFPFDTAKKTDDFYK